MGIHGLMKLLSEECPGCVKEQELNNYTGRKVAIDASMAMYQFLIAVRQQGPGGASAQLTNEAGEVTSHIQGMFNRTIRLMTDGIKPVYVFDGKPPQLKGGELAKRLAKRAKAESDLAAAKEAGQADDIDRFSRRLVKCTRQHNEDCKTLLRLMGVPVVDAPCEAEAQCAELAKCGKVFGVATEDMDALTFATPVLLRKMTFSGAKQPIMEIDFKMVLTGLDLSYAQFVDLCILCGCDYTASIKGVGPKTALKLIKQFNSIENIIKALKGAKKHEIPADWFEQRVPKEEAAAVATASEEKEKEQAENAETTEMETGSKAAPSCDAGDAVACSADNQVEPSEKPEAEAQAVAQAEAEAEEKEEAEEEEMGELDVAALTNAVGDDDDSKEKEEQEAVDLSKYDVIPPMYIQARGLFLQPEVAPGAEVELKWVPPEEEKLTAFLVEKMGFNAERVAAGIKKLVEAQGKKQQQRMDSFFNAAPQDEATRKRKLEAANVAANNKKGKAGAGGAGGKGKGSFGAKKR